MVPVWAWGPGHVALPPGPRQRFADPDTVGELALRVAASGAAHRVGRHPTRPLPFRHPMTPTGISGSFDRGSFGSRVPPAPTEALASSRQDPTRLFRD